MICAVSKDKDTATEGVLVEAPAAQGTQYVNPSANVGGLDGQENSELHSELNHRSKASARTSDSTRAHSSTGIETLTRNPSWRSRRMATSAAVRRVCAGQEISGDAVHGASSANDRLDPVTPAGFQESRHGFHR